MHSGTLGYYQEDARGDTVVVTRQGGAFDSRWQYDAFGGNLSSTGAPVKGAISFTSVRKDIATMQQRLFGRTTLVIVILFSSIFIYRFVLIENSNKNNKIMIAKTYHSPLLSVRRALDLSAMTEHWVVLEGGTYGGVLSPQFCTDAKALIPGIDGYDIQKSVIIWLYEYEPTMLIKQDNLLGDGWLKIYCKKRSVNTVYFAVISKTMVTPSSHIVCRKLGD